MFGHSLTETEKSFLLAFDEFEELVMPMYTLRNVGSKAENRRLINSLVKRNIIIKGKPYKLSKLGKKLRKELDRNG